MWWKMALQVSATLGVMLLPDVSSVRGEALHDAHRAADVQCDDCHQDADSEPPPDGACIACHGTMVEQEDPARAQRRSPDPHRSPHLGPGEVPVCSDCHHVHRESEVTCVMCHRGFKFSVE